MWDRSLGQFVYADFFKRAFEKLLFAKTNCGLWQGIIPLQFLILLVAPNGEVANKSEFPEAMVGAPRFELRTYGTQNRRATRLRHAPSSRLYLQAGRKLEKP